MNYPTKLSALLFALVITTLSLTTPQTLTAQQYNWELVQTQETNQLVVELVTDQGYLVASTKPSDDGTFVSRDRGASWEAFPEAGGFRNYLSIGDQVILGTWGQIDILDLAQGTTETIPGGVGGIDFRITDDGNIGFLAGSRNSYDVVDLDGNVISQNPITNPSRTFIRAIFIEEGFPSYILAIDQFGYLLKDLSPTFEVSDDNRTIPNSVNNQYFYSSGIFYSSQSYSPDGGATWIDYNLPSTAGPIMAHTVEDDILYIAAGESLFISMDMGATFEESVHNEQFTGKVQVHVNNGLISISSDSRRDNKVLTSDDGGNNWTLGTGIFSGIYNGVAANSQGVAISINNDGDQYYGKHIGVEALENDHFIIAENQEFCITPDGQSDFQCTDFTFFEFFYGLFVKQDKVYVANFHNIMVSDDDGASFQSFTSNRITSGGNDFFDAFPPVAFFDNNKFIFGDLLAFEPDNNFILFDLDTETGVTLSQQYDNTIIDIETAFTGPTVYILEYTDENRTELRLLESNDEGLNFTASTLDIPVVDNASYQLLTDHNGHLIIYADTQIFINQNQGADWVDIAPGLDLSDDVITDITVSFDDVIYVSLRDGGIFRLGCMIDDPLADECIIPLLDQDNDGYLSDVDCDDNNAAINPGAPETCNGLDENCNGTIDEGLTTSRYYRDQDGDGYGIDSVSMEACIMPNGFAELFGDCDDTSAAINPAADEIPNNGIDEDCDGLDLASSIHELSNSTVNLYPNPTVDFINIEVTGQLEYQANLYNLEGQLVHSSNNSRLIKVDGLPAGIYLLEIKDVQKNQKIVERIVIEK